MKRAFFGDKARAGRLPEASGRLPAERFLRFFCASSGAQRLPNSEAIGSMIVFRS